MLISHKQHDSFILEVESKIVGEGHRYDQIYSKASSNHLADAGAGYLSDIFLDEVDARITIG